MLNLSSAESTWGSGCGSGARVLSGRGRGDGTIPECVLRSGRGHGHLRPEPGIGTGQSLAGFNRKAGVRSYIYINSKVN